LSGIFEKKGVLETNDEGIVSNDVVVDEDVEKIEVELING